MANQFSGGIAPGGGGNPGVFDAWAGLPRYTPVPGAAPSPYTYGTSPSPGGPGGITPGAVGLPQPYRDLENVYQQLPNTNVLAGNALNALLGGTLSNSARDSLQNAGATWAQSNGMTLGGADTISGSRLLREALRTSDARQLQGLQAYPGLIGAISNTQTVNPAVQAQIARGNADAAVAGNQARYAQNLYRDQFNMANPQRPNVTGPIPAAMAPGGGGGGGGQAPRPNLSPFGSGGVIAPQYGTRNDGSGVTQNPLMSGGAWYAQPAIPSYAPNYGGSPIGNYGGGGGGGGSPFVPDYGAPSYDSPYNFFDNYGSGGGGGGGGSPFVPDYGAAANDAPYNFFQDYGGGGGSDYAASDYGGSGGGWDVSDYF